MQTNASATATVEEIYTTRSMWAGDSDHTLVVDCSDPRMPLAREEFLHDFCEVFRYDPIFAPGGPVLLTFSNPSCFVDQERVRLLHGLHKFKRVIGIAHSDCAYYKLKYPHANEEDRHRQQIADLHLFKEDMRRLAPEAAIELFYAGPNGKGFTEYRRVA